jgi:hypothetical protein
MLSTQGSIVKETPCKLLNCALYAFPISGREVAAKSAADLNPNMLKHDKGESADHIRMVFDLPKAANEGLSPCWDM